MIPITHPFRKSARKGWGTRLSLRAGFLEKREKGRTPICFTSTIQEPALHFPR
jgi:hypothetical protein